MAVFSNDHQSECVSTIEVWLSEIAEARPDQNQLAKLRLFCHRDTVDLHRRPAQTLNTVSARRDRHRPLHGVAGKLVGADIAHAIWRGIGDGCRYKHRQGGGKNGALSHSSASVRRSSANMSGGPESLVRRPRRVVRVVKPALTQRSRLAVYRSRNPASMMAVRVGSLPCQGQGQSRQDEQFTKSDISRRYRIAGGSECWHTNRCACGSKPRSRPEMCALLLHRLSLPAARRGQDERRPPILFQELHGQGRKRPGTGSSKRAIGVAASPSRNRASCHSVSCRSGRSTAPTPGGKLNGHEVERDLRPKYVERTMRSTRERRQRSLRKRCCPDRLDRRGTGLRFFRSDSNP